MDKGKEKRKRGEKESERARKRKVIRGGEKAEEEENVVAVATEEEVEEFCAILKRIQAAANYFGKGKGNGERWRAAIEAVVVEDVVDGDHGKEGEIIVKSPGAEEVAAAEEAEEECGVLDLNATPVAESNGA